MKFKLLLSISMCAITTSAQTPRIIAPNTTDANIDAASNAHYVYINAAAGLKNKLVVFFPGTGGAPAGYQAFLKLAANLGYHTIGLDYPNPVTINSVCGSSNDTTCFTNARLEVFDGVDRNATIQVNKANSIQNRLIKLLKYLNTNYASEGWSQFYSNDSIINWDKIVLSGHSQGGGHAGIISKYSKVDRVIMFAAADWMVPKNKPASWISMNGQTPKDRYWGFTHQQDELVNFDIVQVPTWQSYGMYAFGATVDVDSISDYQHSRTLTTTLMPATSPDKYHNACVVTLYTPKDNQGNPVYAPVWEYLLTAENTNGVTELASLQDWSFFPNPAETYITIDISKAVEMSFYNILGEEVMKMQLIKGTQTIDITTLQKGVYFLQIQNEQKNNTRLLIKQ